MTVQTIPRDLIVRQGAAFIETLPYAGVAGRGQRMHIRTATSAATVVRILSHNGDANSRVIFDGSDSIVVTIGASISSLWLVGADRVEWVYDIEDYSLSDADDVVIPYAGKVIVYGNRTRAEDVTPSAQMPSGDGRYVRFDGEQTLTTEQKLQARENIGAGSGGSGSGDVVGPASATDDRIAAFDGTTGKLIKQGSVTATAVASHIGSTSNPHSTTAAQVGADAAGTASAAVAAHAIATDPHGDRSFATSAVSTHAALTTGAHGITAAGAALATAADAAAQRTALGLGGAAVLAVGTTAGTVAAGNDSRLTDDRTASGLRTASTVVSVSAASAPSSGQVLTATSSTAADWQTPASGTTSIDIQEFTSSGTWTKPANAKRVLAFLVGAGSGGGGGACNAATSVYGGGGGGGGRMLEMVFDASELSATEAVAIGAGGAGSVGVSTGFAAASTAGGATVFAGCNAAGGKSASASGVGGEGGGSYNVGAYPNFTTNSVTGSGGTSTTSSSAAGQALFFPSATGGGAGGYVSAGGSAQSGAAGGTISTFNPSYGVILTSAAGGAGGTAGGAGTAGSKKHRVGLGGGGGASAIAGTAGAGGAGGYPGGGGGGGGAAITGATSGAGGAGANGYALIITECWA